MLLIHLILIFIIYSLYVQFSSTMGNIWLRRNSEDTIIFCPMSLFHLMISPLMLDRVYFWQPCFWTINIFMYFILYYLLYLLVHICSYLIIKGL